MTDDLSERCGAGVITRRDGEGVDRSRTDAKPLFQAPPAGPRGTEHEDTSGVVTIQLRADQMPVAKSQLFQVERHRSEILVVKVALQRVQQRRHAGRAELLDMVIGDIAQLLEADERCLELVDGSREDGRRIVNVVSPDSALVLQRPDSNLVHLPDHLRVGDAVHEDLLAVHDGLGVVETRKDDTPGHIEQKPVAVRHCLEQRRELEILHQVRVIRRQLGPEVEVLVFVQQMGLHVPTLRRRRS